MDNNITIVELAQLQKHFGLDNVLVRRTDGQKPLVMCCGDWGWFFAGYLVEG